MNKETTLAALRLNVGLGDRIRELEAECGSLREAARRTSFDAGYLLRLRDGEKTNPSAESLKRLGLRRVVMYERIKSPNQRYGVAVQEACYAGIASTEKYIPKLLPQKLNQAKYMLICEGTDPEPQECGHWYSPDAVEELIQAACASKQKEINAFNRLNQALFTQIEQTNEYINHTLNAVDNLNDMPISEDWAKQWVDKSFKLLERNNYFRGLSFDTCEEKLPVNPEEVYSPHTEVLK